jgi:hypothetical protein
MSEHERTGWRDEEISLRHRQWGFNVPAVDIDFLLAEYDNRRPVAVIDYKHYLNSNWQKDRANIEALSHFYTESGEQLPFFVVRYRPSETWEFNPHPVNSAGTAVADRFSLGYGTEILSESAYVQWMYQMRGRAVPARWVNDDPCEQVT